MAEALRYEPEGVGDVMGDFCCDCSIIPFVL